MVLASIYYLGTTLLMFAIFAWIVARTYSRKNRERGELAKYRMLEDDPVFAKVEQVTQQEVTHVR